MAARKTAREIAKQWGLSRRDAHRHFVSGTLPKTRARPQRKNAPAAAAEVAEPLESILLADLKTARDALQRISQSPEFTDTDLDMLRAHVGTATALLKDWMDTVAEAGD